ncbi:MAG: tetratricopeptide repeat protein, partial [Oscillospiraceae bacterium]|nr:tetratricopeptide repeat protein [Oscillospiraceae bacterium]
MKILFCNITYMNHYTGNIDEDIPQGGGAWVKTHKDAHEKWNFLNVDGNCYGFVMNQSEQFHIERIEGTSRQETQTEDVTVVWCALKPSGDTVIVGWYEHATVYRYYQSSIPTPVGLDRDYFVQAKADDCYLLPEELRTYPIGRAATDGKGRGFGQSNFWYADSEYAKENIVPGVVSYLQANRQHRINKCCAEYRAPIDLDIPLSEKEDALATEYYDGNEYMRFLPLGYRAYHHAPTGDNAFFIATALKA